MLGKNVAHKLSRMTEEVTLLKYYRNFRENGSNIDRFTFKKLKDN